MKKGIITMIALVLGITGMNAQNMVSVAGAGDLTLRKGEQVEINEGSVSRIENKIFTSSYKDADITLTELHSLTVSGAGDVIGKGTFLGDKLSITSTGTGDILLDIDYDTVTAVICGIGDVNLTGRCRYLKATISGLGDLETSNLQVDSLSVLRMNPGRAPWVWSNDSYQKGDSTMTRKGPRYYKSLWYSPYWQGVEAGLNMLLGPGSNAEFSGDYSMLSLRPLNSWNFNFNIADIGLAFNHSHSAGIYTGIGLGWNNYSFSHPIRLEKGDDKLLIHAIDEEVEGRVRRSKLGVLYLQAPLMVEVRPSRYFYIALGVTGGLRIDTWTKVKFMEGNKEKHHDDYDVNLLKLDASLRAGNDDFGFFAHYNLLPLFRENKAPDTHCLSFGFSVNF